jgi:hypothetical protein
MRLLGALGCAGLTFKAFSHSERRSMVMDGFGAEAADVTPARLSYQLTTLRGQGLLRTVPWAEPLRADGCGYRVAIYCNQAPRAAPRADARESLDRVARPALVGSAQRLDRALLDLNTHFDQLAAVVGLTVAP